MNPSPRQIQREMETVLLRIEPVAREYFDGYFLVGRRAGTAHLTMRVMRAADEAAAIQLEDEVIALAAEIQTLRKNAAP